jgi:RNA polymerase sigma factor (sigma-70 family)
MSDPASRLCELARAGDREAAGELVSLFYERLYAWLRRLAGSDEDAADLTQKTFARAWAALESWQGRSSFSTWLHGIGHHVYVDWRRAQPPAALPLDEWWAHRPDDAPDPFEAAAGRDLAERLFAQVERLDEDTRQTVHLHYYQGLSLSETAEVLGIATSTVKYRLRQALDFLKVRLAESKAPVR